MGELVLCVVLSPYARSAGYTRWVSPGFVWFSPFVHVVQVTSDGSACSLCGTPCVGYTRWVNLRFVWHSLLPHVVQVTPDG